MSIEELTSKLMALASQANLSGGQLEEAKTTMKALKKLGLSNEEISAISKGRWSPSSVKGYCVGISTPSPSPWDNVVALLTDVLASGFSLEDVSIARTVNKELKNKKVSIDDVTELINAAGSSGIELATLVAQGAELKEAGVSPNDILPVVTMVKHLKENGLALASLPLLVKLTKNYGNIEKVLEAVSVYGSLKQLLDEIDNAHKGLDKIAALQKSAESELQKVQGIRVKLQDPISAYEKAFQIGFGQKELSSLSEIAAQYGGSKAVIQAVKKYASLEDINANVIAAKSELASTEAKTSQAITRYGHLVTAIKMCETLIADHQYGLDAIGTILEVAKKFGEPVAVLKAIDNYGGIVSLENRASELVGTVAEREKLLAALEAQFKEALVNLDGLYGVVLEVADKRGRLEGEFKASENLQRVLTLINNPEGATFGEHGQIVLMLRVSLQRWVKSHHESFKWSTDNIEAGFKRLIEELGGTVL